MEMTRKGPLSVALSLALICIVGCHKTNPQNWGLPNDGLQMSLFVKTKRKSDIEFNVTIRNIGEKDVVLNLGMILANGKFQLPDKISLHVTDETGNSRELHFSDKRFSGIAGRVDAYVVPLRARSTYSLVLRLDQFISPATGEFDVKLKGGKYKIRAKFHGEGVREINNDTQGIELMNFWKGNLHSNTVLIEEQ